MLSTDDGKKDSVSNFFGAYTQSLTFVRPIVIERNLFSRRNIEMKRSEYLMREMKRKIVLLLSIGLVFLVRLEMVE